MTAEKQKSFINWSEALEIVKAALISGAICASYILRDLPVGNLRSISIKTFLVVFLLFASLVFVVRRALLVYLFAGNRSEFLQQTSIWNFLKQSKK